MNQEDEAAEDADIFEYLWFPDDGLEESTFGVELAVGTEGESQLTRVLYSTSPGRDLRPTRILVATDRGITLGSSTGEVLGQYDGEQHFDDAGRSIEFHFGDGGVSAIVLQ